MKQILMIMGLVTLAGSVTTSVQAQSGVAKDTKRLENPGALKGQHFYCNTGFTLPVCQQHVAKLKETLKQSPAGASNGWRWVIIRSEDWTPLLASLQLDNRAVVFSSLGLRSTFLEEALFFSSARRAHELVRDFHAPFDQLLWIAVSHELAHAICDEQNEAVASHLAEQLRNGQAPECGVASQSVSLTGDLQYNRLTHLVPRMLHRDNMKEHP